MGEQIELLEDHADLLAEQSWLPSGEVLTLDAGAVLLAVEPDRT